MRDRQWAPRQTTEVERPETDASVSDAVLVTRAQHDRAAFAPLFDRYWDPIFRFCYYRVGDWQEAEDAASQVFANALGGLARFRPAEGDDPFRSWLFAIAHRVVLNNRRRRARHPERPLDIAVGLADAGSTPEEQALSADDHRLVLSLLDRLKPEQRELLELRLAGLTDAEIARVLGRSHDAVRKAQSRTVHVLRDLLGIAAGKEAARG